MYYDRINISEGIDPIKSNRSKECIIWHYYFFNHGFKFHDFVCNGCIDLMYSLVAMVALLLSLLKMSIITVLFIILANRK